VYYKGKKCSTEEVYKRQGWEPIRLKSKEGLALLNGTQFMSAYGVHCLLKASRLSYLADVIGAVSLDAFDCRIEPFDAKVHGVRPHRGQLSTAKIITEFLQGSELIVGKKQHVQDPYSKQSYILSAPKDIPTPEMPGNPKVPVRSSYLPPAQMLPGKSFVVTSMMVPV